MPKALINGVNIYYEITGQGFPLVFCHEVASSYESWEAQVEFFSRNYRVVTYNARGYPPSDVPDDVEAYSEDIAVEDLHQLLRYLEIEEAYLCGLFMGGHTALKVAIAHPAMVKALVVSVAAPGEGTVAERTQRMEERARQIEAQGMEVMDEYTRNPTRIQLLHKRPETWAEFNRLLMAHSPKGTSLVYQGILGGRPPIYDLEPKLREFTVPTLIMVGDEDGPRLEPNIFLKRMIPASGMVVFPQTGHTINLEEPELFNLAVQNFLSAVEAGRWTKHDPDVSAGFPL